MKRVFLTMGLSFMITVVLAQGFKFSYVSIGLGSNMYRASDPLVDVVDTNLYYAVYEIDSVKRAKDANYESDQKAYKVSFRQTSIDSILQLLKGKEGKYIYNSNPNIMSGGIDKLYIEYANWCVEFSLKNITDSTAAAIAAIINTYLPKDHTIHFLTGDWKGGDGEPLIKDCPQKDKSYREILMQDYELLRKKKQ